MSAGVISVFVWEVVLSVFERKNPFLYQKYEYNDVPFTDTLNVAVLPALTD